MSTAIDYDVLVLQSLDFPIPCEHSGHDLNHGDEPAFALIKVIAPCGCQDTPNTYHICRAGYEILKNIEYITCTDCRVKFESRDIIIEILEYVN